MSKPESSDIYLQLTLYRDEFQAVDVYTEESLKECRCWEYEQYDDLYQYLCATCIFVKELKEISSQIREIWKDYLEGVERDTIQIEKERLKAQAWACRMQELDDWQEKWAKAVGYPSWSVLIEEHPEAEEASMYFCDEDITDDFDDFELVKTDSGTFEIIELKGANDD